MIPQLRAITGSFALTTNSELMILSDKLYDEQNEELVGIATPLSPTCMDDFNVAIAALPHRLNYPLVGQNETERLEKNVATYKTLPSQVQKYLLNPELRWRGDWRANWYGPRPICCAQARDTIIRYHNSGPGRSRGPFIDYFVPFPEINKDRKAGWVCHGQDISHCPFCGQRLPAVELDPNPVGWIYTLEGDGDYCGTCEERSMCCECRPPEARYRVIR